MANKKIHYSRLDHLCFEQIWTQICSALDCGADCINEALIGLTTTVAIATKPHQSHNVASSLMMFLILSHDLVTSESKATFNPYCGFSFNGASDFNTDINHDLQTAVWLIPNDAHNWIIWTNNYSYCPMLP